MDIFVTRSCFLNVKIYQRTYNFFQQRQRSFPTGQILRNSESVLLPLRKYNRYLLSNLYWCLCRLTPRTPDRGKFHTDGDPRSFTSAEWNFQWKRFCVYLNRKWEKRSREHGICIDRQSETVRAGFQGLVTDSSDLSLIIDSLYKVWQQKLDCNLTKRFLFQMFQLSMIEDLKPFH